MSHLAKYLPEWRFLPFRNSLSGAEAVAYDTILEGVFAYSELITLPKGLSSDAVFEICNQMDHEVPEIVFLSNGSVLLSNDEVRSYRPKYRFSEDIAKKVLDAMAEETEPILEQTAGLNNVQRVLAFHNWILDRYEYDDADKSYTHVAAGAILFGICVCEGVAKAMKYLCDRARIECVVMVGEAGNDPIADGNRDWGLHAWNVINFSHEGTAGYRWHHVDVTWDHGHGKDRPKYSCFGLSDAEIVIDHELRRREYYPICPTSLDFFKRIGHFAQNGQDLFNLVRKVAMRGGTTVAFKTLQVVDRTITPEREDVCQLFLTITQSALKECGIRWESLSIASDYKRMVFMVKWY